MQFFALIGGHAVARRNARNMGAVIYPFVVTGNAVRVIIYFGIVGGKGQLAAVVYSVGVEGAIQPAFINDPRHIFLCELVLHIVPQGREHLVFGADLRIDDSHHLTLTRAARAADEALSARQFVRLVHLGYLHHGGNRRILYTAQPLDIVRQFFGHSAGKAVEHRIVGEIHRRLRVKLQYLIEDPVAVVGKLYRAVAGKFAVQEVSPLLSALRRQYRVAVQRHDDFHRLALKAPAFLLRLHSRRCHSIEGQRSRRKHPRNAADKLFVFHFPVFLLS